VARQYGVSTYLYQHRRIGRDHLLEIAAHGFDIVELFTDSPWVQAVAMRRGGGDLEAERRRVRADAGRIAYSPLWTELFDYSIRSQIEGTMTLTQALEAMQDDSRGEEIPMFRAAFLDVWRYNEQAWGPIPEHLAKP